MIGVSLLASAAAGPALGQEKQEQYIQVAEIEIDPSQIDAYRTAVKEHIEMAVRVEPGVLTLYAVSDKDDPSKVKVFEIYRDGEAYVRKYATPTSRDDALLEQNLPRIEAR
ncbi:MULTISPECIES: putative quinol monooxygenase [Bradyrhizobium]|uniref:putative quinol monooxygenase n=1 Tax=Bradyrhizobium TaxID=374 RepID=UPI001FEE7E91|nr:MULTISPECIES: antibiotic biosynthesis monooxygenase [Bradyrhizobium]